MDSSLPSAGREGGGRGGEWHKGVGGQGGVCRGGGGQRAVRGAKGYVCGGGQRVMRGADRQTAAVCQEEGARQENGGGQTSQGGWQRGTAP